MYKNLSKKEKQKKLALARKRAVVWSAQEQRRKALRNTASLVKSSTPITSPIPTEETDIFYPTISDQTPIEDPPVSESSDTTVAALQATLSDLLEQRRQLDITIQVLLRRLDSLTASDKKPSSSKR